VYDGHIAFYLGQGYRVITYVKTGVVGILFFALLEGLLGVGDR
jgi:hypothetical protein